MRALASLPALRSNRGLPSLRWSSGRPSGRFRWRFGVLFLFLLYMGGCEGESGGDTEVTREALPGGGTLVSYGPLPEVPDHVLEPDLRIGTLEGPDHEVFGDIRGVDAGPDGAIYILDFQAREIRVFEPDGSFREVLARGGEGPGELQAANGIYMDREGHLWVNDHGKMRYMALDPATGEELQLVDFPVRAFGGVWHGTRDMDGRFWMATSEVVSPISRSMESGPEETEFRRFMTSIDPATETVDSVYLGTRTDASYRHVEEGMSGVMGIPFAPSHSLVVDPDGGFWGTPGAPYEVVRLDEAGDTVLVIESSQPRAPVTEDMRAQHLAAASQERDWVVEATSAAMEMAPDYLASTGHLVLDDEGRLWVQRIREPGEPRLYDLFDGEGNHLSTLEFGFEPLGWAQPRIRDGQLYIQAPGEMDVPTVVRVPLPEL
ncbi:MAG: hypothetical protein EA352_10445 [Gemmatimonadales bacterium]|nr:MAG: hypothetical protein EA352_10445 [Gemmatimonadales bacterium]